MNDIEKGNSNFENSKKDNKKEKNSDFAGRIKKSPDKSIDEKVQDFSKEKKSGKSSKNKGNEDKETSNDKKELQEAEKQIQERQNKEKKNAKRTEAEVWLDTKKSLDRRINNLKELSSGGKIFASDLNREATTSLLDLEGVPEELKGFAKEYYQKQVEEIIKEKLVPKEPEKQTEVLREYLKILRTGRLSPDLIGNNPIWIEMTSMVPHFHPEVQKEFKARFEIFRYTLGFKDADGVEGGVAGSSRVHLSHIGKALKVPEIGKAYDLIEEGSRVTKETIMVRDHISEKEAEEQMKKENPLYTGSGEQNKAVLENLSLKLAKSLGENTRGLNDDEKEKLTEKYMWAVEEAEDIWRITFRSDESDIGIKGHGGQWYLNRLYHYSSRLNSKGLGYESTRKYFDKPFFPEDVAPSKKGEGRGLMIQGFWESQIGSLKMDGLEALGFEREGGKDYIYYGKDGNGRELPYVIYKKDFITPEGRSEKMEVRMSVDKKGKFTNVIEVANPSAKILSEICEKVPEGFYGSYVGDWIFKAESTRKLLEGGVLKFPPGSEENMERTLADLRSKKLFDHLDSLEKDGWERKPGKYYQEDAWEDLIRGAIDFGLHEGKHMFEPWKIWGAWRAGVLTKKATDLKVITDEQGEKVENEMLTFMGMKGNIPRLLRCNFDRFTMVYRWGPMRGMMLGEIIKQFFQGILPELPSAPRKK